MCFFKMIFTLWNVVLNLIIQIQVFGKLFHVLTWLYNVGHEFENYFSLQQSFLNTYITFLWWIMYTSNMHNDNEINHKIHICIFICWGMCGRLSWGQFTWFYCKQQIVENMLGQVNRLNKFFYCKMDYIFVFIAM